MKLDIPFHVDLFIYWFSIGRCKHLRIHPPDKLLFCLENTHGKCINQRKRQLLIWRALHLALSLRKRTRAHTHAILNTHRIFDLPRRRDWPETQGWRETGETNPSFRSRVHVTCALLIHFQQCVSLFPRGLM